MFTSLPQNLIDVFLGGQKASFQELQVHVQEWEKMNAVMSWSHVDNRFIYDILEITV